MPVADRVGLMLLTSLFFSGCAAPAFVDCSLFGDPALAQDEVAVLQIGTASLEAIDGNVVPLGRDPDAFECRDARLYPGRHTLTLRAELPVTQRYERASIEDIELEDYVELKHDLSFRAEPGHIYELHFDRAESYQYGVSWWIMDITTNEVVAGMR